MTDREQNPLLEPSPDRTRLTGLPLIQEMPPGVGGIFCVCPALAITMRSAHQALSKCRDYITEGYVYAVDIDLERFFDTVNHGKLIEVLSRKVKDGRVVSLIHKYLNAGVMKEGRYEETPEGVPQGGPLSPVLSNILLNELDIELERRGHKFVRYADDMVILCRSRRSTERTMQNIISFIEGKLLLKVNRDKSKAAYVREVKFLG